MRSLHRVASLEWGKKIYQLMSQICRCFFIHFICKNALTLRLDRVPKNNEEMRFMISKVLQVKKKVKMRQLSDANFSFNKSTKFSKESIHN